MVTALKEKKPAAHDTESTSAAQNLYWCSIEQTGRILLLGCPLNLTPREREILTSIISRHPAVVSVSEICGEIPGLAAGSVPVHINSINKKSALIGGRRLVVAQRKVGYMINKHM